MYHGFGVLEYGATKSKFEGNFNMGHPVGVGRLTENQLLRYTIESSPPPDKATAQGFFTSVYLGNWKNSIKEGPGIQIYPTGTIYVGEWVQGIRHGKGTLFYPLDRQIMDSRFGRVIAKHQGEFENDKKHGSGKVFDPDGMEIDYLMKGPHSGKRKWVDGMETTSHIKVPSEEGAYEEDSYNEDGHEEPAEEEEKEEEDDGEDEEQEHPGQEDNNEEAGENRQKENNPDGKSSLDD